METGCPKCIDCIRVDGASDEGPGHEEVQFWWARRHLEKMKVATLVTTRSSGSSYMNRVELQNGCLAQGHAGLFIPSTLGGSCYNPQTGAIDEALLRDLAIDTYISRVNNSPCSHTTIKLFKGADSTSLQQMRSKLQIFLKGSVQNKDKLRKENPSEYEYFLNIWEIRRRHMVPGLPPYIYFLLCCYQDGCGHPLGQSGRPVQSPLWYPGCPSISFLPLPVPDPERPWGNTSCLTCNPPCARHYKQNHFTDVLDCNTQAGCCTPVSCYEGDVQSTANRGNIGRRIYPKGSSSCTTTLQ